VVIGGGSGLQHCFFPHVRGIQNSTADLLSRWNVTNNPISKLFVLLNEVLIWLPVYPEALTLNESI
jgi:hypothetical protein